VASATRWGLSDKASAGVAEEVGKAGFVTVEGPEFRLDGRSFYFGGTNLRELGFLTDRSEQEVYGAVAFLARPRSTGRPAARRDLQRLRISRPADDRSRQRRRLDL
jgi:hypothetical protein